MVNYQRALDLIDQYNFKQKTETIGTFDSLGLTLAVDYTSNINVPSYRKSAMDGYALNSNDDLGQQFEVVTTIYAGDNKNPEINSGQCVKIMTGAPVPDNCDLVIVQELSNHNGNTVTFNLPETKLNSNICQIGEDIKVNQLLFTTGTLITPTVISSLISCGIFEVEVTSKPTILLITTGDEVITTNIPLNHGQIYNSNLGYLKARLSELGFTADTIHLTDETLQPDVHNFNNYDLVITTGAISVGERDTVRNYLKAKQPQIIFDRVNIMPGGPVVFWQYESTPVISLAGSPFANFVTFELFARRMLAKLSNDHSLIITERLIKINDNYTKKIKKRRFVKAHLDFDNLTIPATNHLASSMHEMTLCNCLINLERGDYNLQPGDLVPVLDIRRTYE